MTPKEFYDKLRAAKDTSGGPFDVTAFNTGLKSQEVFEELEKLEVIFDLDEDGRPFLFRSSLWMFIRHKDFRLKERYRTRKGLRLKRGVHEQSGTETLRRGQSLRDEARRAFWEEFNLKVEDRHLDFESLFRQFHGTIIRESSVYAGFISKTLIYPVVLDLETLGFTERPWQSGLQVRDNDTLVWCEWEEGLNIPLLPKPTFETRITNSVTMLYGDVPRRNLELENIIAQGTKSA